MENYSSLLEVHNDSYHSMCLLDEPMQHSTSTFFYFFYLCVVVLGLSSNMVIYAAYHYWRTRLLGKRETSAFLLCSLNVLDLLTSVVLAVNLGTRYYESYHLEGPDTHLLGLGLFYSLRNVLISIVMLTLALLAVDRMLAVRYPYSLLWNVRVTRGLYFTVSTSVVVCDLCCRLIIVYHPHCSVSHSMVAVYEVVYGIAAITLMVITYLTYAYLFHGLYQYWRSTQHLHNRVAPVHVSSTGENDASSEAENMKDDMIEMCSGSLSRRPLDHQTSRSISNSMSAHKRLALTLFSISLGHTTSVMPLFLYNEHIIPFPGYILYYFFYMNCILNPCIHIAARAELRAYCKLLFTKPSLAFIKRL